MKATGQEVTIVMIEDDEGHARLIEKNVRRAGVNNEIVPFTLGAMALDYILGENRDGLVSKDRYLLVLLDLNLLICPAFAFWSRSRATNTRGGCRSSC